MANKQDETPSTGDQVGELKNLVVGYAKQETIEPLKSLGRYVGFGAAGGACVGVGVLLLTLALLRGLQTIETINQPDRIHGGTWSWVPYVGALVWMLIVAAVAASAAKRGAAKRRK